MELPDPLPIDPIAGPIDAVVRIPMLGRRDSLNLAIATSLLVYEVFRQRHPVERAASE